MGSPGAPGVLSSRRGDAWAWTALACGVAAVAAWVLSRPAPLALGGDNETLHHPLFVDVLRQLGEGVLPIWTTGRWGGSPLVGDPVLGAAYPPNYLGYLLTAFPHRSAIDVAACVHLAVFATGMLWCCRRLGVRPGPALVATALAIANPALVYVARSWINWWGAISWWPWLFGAALAIARDRRGVALAAVCLAAQIYAGYPQYALHSGLVAVALVLAASRQPWTRRLVDVTLVAGGAIGLALPQLLPGLAMASESMRLGPGGAARLAALDVAALAPATWLDVVRASPTLGVLPCKLAPAVVVLALAGACDRRAAVRVLALAAAVAAVLASGPTPLMHVLHELPLFDFFAGPFKFFYVFAVAAHLLAAVGLERIAAAPPSRARLWLVALALALAPTAGLAVALAALVAAALPERALAAAAATIVLVAGVTLLDRTAALSTPQPFARDAFTPLLRESPVDDRATAADRWLALDEADVVRQTGMNFGALWGVTAVSGVGPLPPWREFDVTSGAERGRAVELAQAVGASRVVVRAGSALAAAFTSAGYAPVRGIDGLAVLATAPSPGAFLVARARSVDASEGVAAARRGSGFDVGETLVEAGGPGAIRVGEVAEGDAAGGIETRERARGAHRWHVTVARTTWLAVREPYYPSWTATVDGGAADVRPAGGFFLAVRVPAGDHVVVLRYREAGLLPGLVVAGLTAVALGVLAARRR